MQPSASEVGAAIAKAVEAIATQPEDKWAHYGTLFLQELENAAAFKGYGIHILKSIRHELNLRLKEGQW